ncbi:MAG TPA: hypothetical protein VF754_08340 [Pyrinomonadaceae bacterium]
MTKRFGKIQTLALAAVVSAVTLAATPAQAQTRREERREDRQERREERREDRQERREERREERRGRNWDRYGQYGGSFQLRQTALNAGYNEGIKVGRNDRNRNRPSNYRNSSTYRNASKDYSSRLGNRALYQRYFRDGFENGYDDGRNGY